jgi:2-hydroxychromene-2-carboxylate isomerase
MDEEIGVLMAAVGDIETKQLLRTATDEAAHEGAFGVPYMCLDGPGVSPSHRVWFGADALPTIAHVLGKQFVVPTSSKL